MATAPPREVIDAILSGDAIITRRAEFYQSDQVTPWLPGGLATPRLIDGAVSIDMSRSERRSLDATFDNADGHLKEDPYSGLWYDKVVKVFRGIKYKVPYEAPRVILIESAVGSQDISSMLRDLGIFTTYKVSAAATLDDLRGYDIVAVDSQGLVPAKVALLKDAYAAGMSILTVSQVGDQTWLPFVTASAAKADDAIKYRMDPPTYDHRLKGGWDNGADDLSSTAGKVITGIDPLSAVGVSVFQYNAVQTYTHVIGSNLQGGRWFHHNNTIIKTASNRILWAKAVSWLHNFKSDRNWEIQLGEFCIDTIAEDNFPPHVKITARDYTKLCIESKLSKATTFSKGQRVEDMIRAVAANCGISRMIVPRMSATLEADVTFDRETERWKIISDLAATVAHEAFFDNMGFLVVRPIADPSLTPITWTFGVGVQNVDEKVTVEILGTNYVHDGGMRSSAPGFGVDGVAGMGFALGDAAIVRRNFVPNPIAAVDLAGYTTWGAGVTHTRMTTGGHLTPECVQVVTPGTAAAEGEGYGVGPVAPNTRSQFAGAVFLKGAVGGEKVNIWARYNYVDGSATSDSVAKNVTLTTGWQRFVANSIPPNAGKEISTVTLFLRTPTILAQTFYVWGTDVAATTDVTQMNSYVDGNQTGCRWVGEPGTSISEQYVRHLSPGKVGVVSLRQDAVSEISTVVRGASYITPVVAGQTVTVIADVFVTSQAPAGAKVGFVARDDVNADSTLFTSADIVPRNQWTTVSGTFTVKPSRKLEALYVRLTNAPTSLLFGEHIYVKDVGVIIGDGSEWFDGARGPETRWRGAQFRSPAEKTKTTTEIVTTLDASNANLVTYQKSSNDSRVKNYVIVTGDGDTDTNPLGFYGEAKNQDPNSPTRIRRLGERTWFFNSALFTSDQQCVDLARKYLMIMALEEFNISFTSVVFPWLEVADIVHILTGEQTPYEPTRFLLATLTIPLNLSPMSGTGKRVTIVGTANESDGISGILPGEG